MKIGVQIDFPAFTQISGIGSEIQRARQFFPAIVFFLDLSRQKCLVRCFCGNFIVMHGAHFYLIAGLDDGVGIGVEGGVVSAAWCAVLLLGIHTT